jgi:uncharacterized membrane protein YpjA
MKKLAVILLALIAIIALPIAPPVTLFLVLLLIAVILGSGARWMAALGVIIAAGIGLWALLG